MKPEEWTKVKINQFGEIITGSTPDTKNIGYWGGNIPFVSPADFRFSVFVKKTERTLTEQGVKQSRLIPEASILVTCIGSIGGIAIASCNCVTNQQINSVVCNDNIDDLFAYFLIQNNLFKLKELAGITTLPIINKTVFGNIELLCPTSIKEQEKIAEVLSTIDRAIEQTEAIIAKQQRIKTGLMQDLLTKGIDEDGNVRSEETHEFKDSPLGRIPVDWEVEVFGNRVKSSAFGPRFPSTAYSEKGSFAVLRTTDLDPEGKISYEQMPLTNLPEKEFEKHILESGDLLITRSGTCGVPAVFGSFDVPTIPGAFLIRFRLNEDSIKPRYAHIYFNWDIGRKRLLDLAEGGVQKNLRGSTINQMLFVFPNIKEQERIIERFNAVEFEKNLILEHLKKLNSLKTGLMQDLLTGNVRVTELLKDTAEASP